jgi:hypothetical protein
VYTIVHLRAINQSVKIPAAVGVGVAVVKNGEM